MEAARRLLYNIPASFKKLLRKRDELSFSQIRLEYSAYFLPLAIICVLLDIRKGYFFPQGVFLGLDPSTIAYSAYVAGTIIVLILFMEFKKNGFKAFALFSAFGFLLWLILPESNSKMAAMFLFQFGIGCCASYATYTHVFVLNNSERLLSVSLITFGSGVFEFLYALEINNMFLALFVPGLLVFAFVFCTFITKTEKYPDTSRSSSIQPPKGIYLCLVIPFSYFTINAFGEILLKTTLTGNAALFGVGLFISVLLTSIALLGFKCNIWYMLNVFLLFCITGLAVMALPLGEELHSIGKLLYGVGTGFGFMTTFYMIGIIKKYLNDNFFRNIVLATMGELFLAVVLTGLVAAILPGALPAITVSLAVLFLCCFALLSPIFQRNIFDSDWIDDFSKQDISYITKKIELAIEHYGQTNNGITTPQSGEAPTIGNMKTPDILKPSIVMDRIFTPEENEIALLIMDGLTQHEISRKLHLASGEVRVLIEAVRKKVIGEETPNLNIAKEYHLTRRETDMLRYLCRHMTNAEIAAELFLSEETVRTHVRNLMKKLPLENRQDVAAWVKTFDKKTE